MGGCCALPGSSATAMMDPVIAATAAGRSLMRVIASCDADYARCLGTRKGGAAYAGRGTYQGRLHAVRAEAVSGGLRAPFPCGTIGAMPLFEYQCRECERPFESFVTADRKPVCPGCGSENLQKLLSRPGMVGASTASADACEMPAPMCGAQGGRCGCQMAS